MSDKLDEGQISVVLEALKRAEAAKAVNTDRVETVAQGFSSAKNIVAALGFFATLIGGAVVTFQELQAKPTQEDVVKLIKKETFLIEEKANQVETVKSQTASIQKDVDRIEDVLEYQIERDAWRDEVVDHRLTNKRGKPPAKPESLKRKERKLLGIGQ